jgi:hypothetical protein
MENTFIKNKYYQWYNNIIANSCPTSEYIEYHHVIPRSLGGTDGKNNIVRLTAREHFICHVLLTKFTQGSDRHKMLYAANMMSQISRDYQHRYIPNSKIYEMLKKDFSKMHSERLTGKQLSNEHRNKISQSLKGRAVSTDTIQKQVAKNTGKKRTPEQKERMRQAQLTRKQKTEEEKSLISAKISQSLKSKKLGPKSASHKENLSKSLLGKYKGVPKSEETKQKMRKPKSEAHRKAISDGRKAKYAKLREQQC